MTQINPFKPNGLVTGIGSLPMTDPQAAVEWIAETCADLPFWPQLPQRSPEEGMIEQTLAGFGDLLRPRPQSFGYDVRAGQIEALIQAFNDSDVFLTKRHAAGFYAFKTALEAGRFERALAIKGQLTGPITLVCHLFANDRPLTHHQALVKAVSRYVVRLARWQARQLQRPNIPLLLWLDEPCLGLVNADWSVDVADFLLGVLKETIAEIRTPGVLVGLHCCSAPPFALLEGIQLDIISFDAHQHLRAFCTRWDVNPFLARGGLVAFGLIPTVPDLAEVKAREVFFHWLLSANQVVEIPLLARQTMITATCGLGLLDEAALSDSFKLAGEVAALVEEAAGFDLPVK